MIKKEDIKVGLKFFLPCERIERHEDMFLYFVNTRENCYLGLSEPTKAFCVKSVEDNCVCCDVDGRTNVYVTLDILQEKGSMTVKKVMEKWESNAPAKVYFSHIIPKDFVDNFCGMSAKRFADLINKERDALHNPCKAYKAITDEMFETFKAKNHDYGNSFAKLFKECGMTYAYGHLAEKLERVKSLMKDEAKVKGEGMKDSLLDLANYAILTIMELDKTRK